MKKRALTFILAAGGTGGHMFPADALRDELERRGYQVLLFTDSRGLAFPGIFEKTETFMIKSGTFSRRSPIGIIRTGWALFKGFIKAGWLLVKLSPSGVVGFGGYPVVPTMAAARFWNVPYCLHEQNAVLGRANRMASRGARALALSFRGTKKIKWHSRFMTKVTGNPIRSTILALGKKKYPAISKTSKLNLLIFGGSQGASVFSDVVPEALSLLPKALKDRLVITQQCRANDVERVQKAYKTAGIKAEVKTFIRDIPKVLGNTHLVISRAGATSLFEFAGAGRPSILVPLPSAMDDHQTANAKVMEKAGGGWVIPQGEFSAAKLAKQIQKLALNPKTLAEAAEKALTVSHPNAVKTLADLVENMALPKKARSGAKAKGPKETSQTLKFEGALS
jgi:UDP-N-acetylglucosamine--N-acetylmuramyl-(pentapeptide) pyrophosphoryl-undecaprenol N-acetylglucosamine transferase